MTIRRGEPWGEEVAAPDPAVRRVAGDAALHRWLTAVMHGPAIERVVAVADGDLAVTLGGGTPGRLDGPLLRVPIDVVEVVAEGGTRTWSVSHVVARRRWWRGEVVLAMNAQFLGRYDVAPRSHPNDGRVDVVRVDPQMGLRARWQARRRARQGAHLPHPHIEVRQLSDADLTFTRPLTVWVDGVRWGRHRHLQLHVVPDAITVHA